MLKSILLYIHFNLSIRYILHLKHVIYSYCILPTRVVRKIRFQMIFHNEKHVYWH
jgi:hypothetical protein